MATPIPPRLARVALLLCLVASLGPTCKPFKSISFFEPNEGRIQATAKPVFVWGRIGKGFDPLTAAFEVDGVDLVAALGLVPPFQDAGGVVAVGPDLVTVSGFTFDPQGNHVTHFTVHLAGLSAGAHGFAASAENASGVVSRSRSFQLVNAFAEELATPSPAGLPGGPTAIGAGFLANSSLGHAIAAPPVALSGGGSLRSGHVEAAEQRISAGGP